MMPSLHEDLRAAKREGFLDLLVNFVVRNHVGIGRILASPKRAKLAIDVADIRVVDIAIDAVGDDLVAAAVEGVGFG